MKFSLIVAVVVLALAQGSFAQDVPDLEKLGQYFEEIKNKMTQELTELLRNPDLQGHAQTVQTHLEPLATQIQEQLKTFEERLKPVAADVQARIQPMATGVQAHIQPMMENLQKQMESLFQTLTEQGRAIAN